VEPVAVVLGRRIRKLRERQGLTQTELAKLVLSSKTSISEYEQGNRAPDLDLIKRLETDLDADGQLIELHGLLELGGQDSAAVADVEHDALALTDWDMRAIPGLLQTADYARANMAAARVPAEKLNRELSIRLQRQKILDSLVAGWFVLDESVLRRAYGGKDTMRGQLLHLEAIAERPNIGVQVMPYDSTEHPGADGPLRVIEYRDKPGCWFTEGRTSGRMSDDRNEVLAAMHAMNIIRAAALPVAESVTFIRNLRETTYEQLA
jgi:transcriptional regulator with XRE-family HTH domain